MGKARLQSRQMPWPSTTSIFSFVNSKGVPLIMTLYMSSTYFGMTSERSPDLKDNCVDFLKAVFFGKVFNSLEDLPDNSYLVHRPDLREHIFSAKR